MNISLGGAVSPSTKRGRSPRMPGGSAAANRGVAPSRVGKQVRRLWEDRAPALFFHGVALSSLLFGDRSAATVRSTKQVMPSVELRLDRWSDRDDRHLGVARWKPREWLRPPSMSNATPATAARRRRDGSISVNARSRSPKSSAQRGCLPSCASVARRGRPVLRSSGPSACPWVHPYACLLALEEEVSDDAFLGHRLVPD